jgi:hypothetical protein
MAFGYQVLGFGAGGVSSPFIKATGGTITTADTDYKVHTFTGPGSFAVTSVGSCTANNEVSYISRWWWRWNSKSRCWWCRWF